MPANPSITNMLSPYYTEHMNATTLSRQLICNIMNVLYIGLFSCWGIFIENYRKKVC